MAPLPPDVPPPNAWFGNSTVRPKFLSAVAALLTALVYSSMPSCSWASHVNLFFFHYINAFVWALGSSYSRVSGLAFPLMYILVPGSVLPRRARHHPRRDGHIYFYSSRMVFWFAVYHSFNPGGLFFEFEPAGWPHFAMEAVLVMAGAEMYNHSTESAPGIFCRLAIRCIRRWFWGSQNDAEKNVPPVWSVVLSIFVSISAPVLASYQVIGMRAIGRAWHEAQQNPI